MKPIVARITGEPRERNIPTFVTLTKQDINLPYEESWVLLHDLATLGAEHLDELVGELDGFKMHEVEDRLRYVFNLD